MKKSIIDATPKIYRWPRTIFKDVKTNIRYVIAKTKIKDEQSIYFMKNIDAPTTAKTKQMTVDKLRTLRLELDEVLK